MKYLSMLSFISGILLVIAGILFFDYNQPIIKNIPLLLILASIALIPMIVDSVREFSGKTRILDHKRWTGVLFFIPAVLLVYAFLDSALFDYFQPFSLYDDVIYLTLAAFLLLILRFVISGIMTFMGRQMGVASFVMVGISIFLILIHKSQIK